MVSAKTSKIKTALTMMFLGQADACCYLERRPGTCRKWSCILKVYKWVTRSGWVLLSQFNGVNNRTVRNYIHNNSVSLIISAQYCHSSLSSSFPPSFLCLCSTISLSLLQFFSSTSLHTYSCSPGFQNKGKSSLFLICLPKRYREVIMQEVTWSQDKTIKSPLRTEA